MTRSAHRDRPPAVALAGLILLVVLVATHFATPGRAQDALIIATHKEGSAYHTLGVAFAEALTDALEREITVTPYPRWSEYLPLIDAGEVAMGFVTGLDAGALYRAEGDERLLRLRALMRLWPIRYTFLARANLGIDNVVGLTGRHIALDMRRGPLLSALSGRQSGDARNRCDQ